MLSSSSKKSAPLLRYNLTSLRRSEQVLLFGWNAAPRPLVRELTIDVACVTTRVVQDLNVRHLRRREVSSEGTAFLERLFLFLSLCAMMSNLKVGKFRFAFKDVRIIPGSGPAARIATFPL